MKILVVQREKWDYIIFWNNEISNPFVSFLMGEKLSFFRRISFNANSFRESLLTLGAYSIYVRRPFKALRRRVD